MQETIKKVILVPLCAMFVFAGPAVSHQGINVDQLFSLSLKELMEVEVTSPTLTSKNLRTAPASISVFTHDQIYHMGADYLHELINFVPGFQSFRQGADSLQYFHSARGHRSSVKSREILILLDGVRLIREADNGAAIPMLSLYNVAKVEFIRGPGSAIYGSNAFFGVINIETIRGQNAIHMAAGEVGRKQANGTFSLTKNDLQFDLALNAFDENGALYTLEDINQTPYTTEPAKDPRQGGDVQFSMQKGNTQLNALLSKRRAEDYYIVERLSNELNQSDHDSAHIHFVQGINWNSRFQSTMEFVYSENAFNLNTIIGGLGVTRSRQDEKNVHLTARNGWQYDDQDSLEFGLELRNSEMTSEYTTDTYGTLEFYPQTTRTITGIYIQNQRYYENGLQLVLGGRFDHYDDSGSSFSPRLSLVYPFSDHQTLKFLYGEAFRAPTPNELDLVGVTLTGNPDLKPETVKTSELIWMGQWGHHSTTLNAYYNVIEDSIYSTNTFLNQKSNEEYYGVELEYAFQLSKRWLVQISGSMMEDLPDTDFREADRLATFLVNYRGNAWNLNLSTHYAGPRELFVGSEELEIDDYWLVNSKWIYYLSPRANVYVNGRNLIDEDYGTPNRLALHTVPMPNRGREVVLGVEYEF